MYYLSQLQVVYPEPGWSVIRKVCLQRVLLLRKIMDLIQLFEYGHTRIQIANSTALHMQFVDNTAEIEDDFWIIQEGHLQYLQ